jgi:hypothetical protein
MPTRRWASAPLLADGVFAAALAGLIAYALWLGRDLSFFSDEWNFIVDHHRGAYLTPYNGHLGLVPVGIFHTLYTTVGLGSYTPYRIVGLVGYAALSVILYIYARQRVQPWLAAIAALAVAWFSTAQLTVLFPLLINFTLPLATMVAIWMLLDRNTPRTDLFAGACLAFALATSAIGLIALVVVAAELVLKRAPIRRWLPFVVPFGVWFIWWLGYHTSTPNPEGVGSFFRYAFDEMQATFTAFAVSSEALGYVLIVATVALLAVSIVRWKTFTPRAAAALVGFGAFAFLSSYGRSGFIPPVPADTPRYLWFNAFFLVIAVIEVIRGRRLPSLVTVLAGAMVVVGAVTLVGNLQDDHARDLAYKLKVRSFLVATEAIPDKIDPQRVLPVSFVKVHAGEYLAAVRHLGSPVDGVGLNGLGKEVDRRTADGWMIHDLGLAFSDHGLVDVDKCVTIPADKVDHGFEVRGPAVVVVQVGSSAVDWSIRRLAQRFGAAEGRLAENQDEALQIPRDHSKLPWHLRIAGGTASVSVCRA